MSLGAGALEGLVEPGNSSGRGKEVSIVTLQAATAQTSLKVLEQGGGRDTGWRGDLRLQYSQAPEFPRPTMLCTKNLKERKTNLVQCKTIEEWTRRGTSVKLENWTGRPRIPRESWCRVDKHCLSNAQEPEWGGREHHCGRRLLRRQSGNYGWRSCRRCPPRIRSV